MNVFFNTSSEIISFISFFMFGVFGDAIFIDTLELTSSAQYMHRLYWILYNICQPVQPRVFSSCRLETSLSTLDNDTHHSCIFMSVQ